MGQAEFARLIGFAKSAVSMWEDGLRVPRETGALAYGRQLAALKRRLA